MSKRPTKKAQKAIIAKRAKDRRQSRDFEAVRRDLDTRNAANRLRASQLSQYSQPDTSMYQPPPAPNISSSSSSAIIDINPLYDGNDDDRSETNSPVKHRGRFVSPVKNRPPRTRPP
jgi:hypothetical protein